jgi:hypothetical protein
MIEIEWSLHRVTWGTVHSAPFPVHCVYRTQFSRAYSTHDPPDQAIDRSKVLCGLLNEYIVDGYFDLGTPASKVAGTRSPGPDLISMRTESQFHHDQLLGDRDLVSEVLETAMINFFWNRASIRPRDSYLDRIYT